MNVHIKISAVILTLFAGLSAHASERCLDEALVNEIRSRIDLKTSDVATFDRCKPGSRTHILLEALMVIKTMEYSDSNLGAPFNQRILAGNFWNYFAERTQTIQEEDTCQGGVLGFVWGHVRDGVIHVCPALFANTLLKYERVQILLHEVRHFEGYRHVECVRGARKGMAGRCDEKIEDKGSYAVSVEVLTKMALMAPNVPHVQKAMLKTLALAHVNETFNQPVYDHDMTAFYLEDPNKNAFLYSNKGLISVAALGEGKIVSRGFALAMFPADKSDAYMVNVFSKKMDFAPAQGSFSNEYNLTPIAQRDSVVDILNLEYLSASITGHRIKANLKDESDAIIDLPWTAIAAFSGPEVGVPDEDSIYVLNDQRSLFRLQLTGNTKYKLTQIPNIVEGVQQFSIFNGKRMALDVAGKVLVETDGVFIPFAPLKTMTFDRMTRPFTWDQYFED